MCLSIQGDHLGSWSSRNDLKRDAAVVAFVNQSFVEDASLTTLIARVKDGNIASRRVLEKAGFKPDGVAGPDWSLFRRSR